MFEFRNPRETELEERAKLIGAYATKNDAEAAIERLKSKPGFCDYPTGFIIEEYSLNMDHWTEGFFTFTGED